MKKHDERTDRWTDGITNVQKVFYKSSWWASSREIKPTANNNNDNNNNNK